MLFICHFSAKAIEVAPKRTMQEKFHRQRVPKVLISKVQGVLIKKSSFGGLFPVKIKSVHATCAAAVNSGPASSS